MIFRSCVLVIATIVAGCSADARPAITTGDGGVAPFDASALVPRPDATSASVPLTDAGLAGGGFTCQQGAILPCVCDDGLPRGTQNCGPDATLTACACPVLDAGRPPSTMPSAALCPGLSTLGNGCEAKPYVSVELPSSLLFVVDRSRSMLCNLPPLQTSSSCEASPRPVDAASPSKWQIVQSALANVFRDLPGDNVLAGLSFFSVDGACGVASNPAVSIGALDEVQRGTLSAVLEGTRPDGKTPIVGATMLAYAHLHQEARAPGNRFVILLTDGAESCSPDAVPRLLDTEVAKARDANVRTFVIGAPGSEPARALLSELAFRGGTALSPSCIHEIGGDPSVGDCHFDMSQSDDFASALSDALKKVSEEAVGCEFTVPNTAGGPTKDVNVQFTAGSGGTPECFAKDDSAPCDHGANGWQFARDASGAEDLTKVRLCGPPCQRLRIDPGARIDVLVGCAPITLR